MSRVVLTKLDVDVLVQVAVLGPLEATSWEPLVEDPDELGGRLWSANAAIAGPRRRSPHWH